MRVYRSVPTSCGDDAWGHCPRKEFTMPVLYVVPWKGHSRQLNEVVMEAAAMVVRNQMHSWEKFTDVYSKCCLGIQRVGG